jgi:AraC-like DNA-binding protein/mannose-6-phosphate isomerase-like protein (cupin superfamily)
MKAAPASRTAKRSARPPIVAFRRLDDDAFPLVTYRRDGARTIHSPELHGHRFFVLFVADGGSGKLHFTGKSVHVTAGHVHLLAPGELHDTSALGSVTGWAAEFTEEALVGLGAGITPFLPRSGEAHWVGFARRASGIPAFTTIPEADRWAWGRRFEVLDQELREARLGYREAARAQLQIILINAARLIAPLASGDAIPPLVNEVFTVIERRFAEPISLDDVARAVGRSASHLTATVRKATGMTVLEWITERRMAEARRRLRETDEDIAIVAERVGYHDATYFIRLFRRAHQTTPRAFRVANRRAGSDHDR